MNDGTRNVQMPYVGDGTGKENVAHNFGFSCTVENADIRCISVAELQEFRGSTFPQDYMILRIVRSRNMFCSPENGLNGERRLGHHNLPARTLLVGVRQAMVTEIAGS